jgi:hypothetical protein
MLATGALPRVPTSLATHFGFLGAPIRTREDFGLGVYLPAVGIRIEFGLQQCTVSLA